jgi:hypothetical protein
MIIHKMSYKKSLISDEFIWDSYYKLRSDWKSYKINEEIFEHLEEDDYIIMLINNNTIIISKKMFHNLNKVYDDKI